MISPRSTLTISAFRRTCFGSCKLAHLAHCALCLGSALEALPLPDLVGVHRQHIFGPLSLLYRTSLSFQFCCLSLLWAVRKTKFDCLSASVGLCAPLGLFVSTSGLNVGSDAPSNRGCPERPIAAPQTEAQQRRRSPHSYR